MKAGTHDGVFHADDVFSTSFLKIVYPDVEIIRSRDKRLLDACDLRFDVGGKYNKQTLDFDHHQADFKFCRENGIPYSSFGLLWKYMGNAVYSKELVGKVDEEFVQHIDAVDNGKLDIYGESDFVMPSISKMISDFNPTWEEADNNNFDKAVSVASSVLIRTIKRIEGKMRAETLVRSSASKAIDPKIIILNESMPWQEVVVNEFPEALFVVYPAQDVWRGQVIPKNTNTYEARKNFPKQWGGLEKEEFSSIVGINDVIFAHRGLFLVGAKSKESVIKLVKMAINNENE